MAEETSNQEKPVDIVQTLIDNFPAGMIVFAPDSTVIFCNPMAADLLGLSPDQLLSQKAGNIPFRFTREDGSRVGVEDYPFIKTLGSGDQVEDSVFSIDSQEGKRKIWILTHTYPEYNQQGRLIRVVMVMQNVTSRKEAEEKFQEEQILAKSLMDNLQDCIYFKDRESRFLRVNNAEARLLGIADPAQAKGKTDRDFFAGEHAEKAFRDEQEILRTGKPMLAKEEKLSYPDGRTAWVLSSKMPLFGMDGKIIGTFGVSYDITRRKEAEEKLAESESRFRTLFEGAAVGVAMMETHTGKFLRVNRRYCEMLGYTEKELMETTFLKLTHEEDIEDSHQQMGRLVANQIRDFTVEKRYIRKDGGVLYAEVSVSPMWAPGEEPTAHITVAQDITQRKLAEVAERAAKDFLEKLVDNASAPIITWDAGRRVTLFNRALEQLTGMASGEVLGETVDRLFPDQSRERSLERVNCTLRGDQLQMVELPIQQKNGGERLVVWNSSNLYSANGRSVQTVIAIGQDITERYRVEQSLLRHTFELELGQQFSRILRDKQTVAELVEAFLQNTLSYLSLEGGAVYLEGGEDGLLHLETAEGWLSDPAPKVIQKDAGIAGEVLASQKPIQLDRFFPDPFPGDSTIFPAENPGGVCAPLATEGVTIGVVFLTAPSAEGFHEQEIRLIMILADLLTNAIKRTRLRLEVEQSYEELKMIDARRQKIQDLLAREKEFLNVTLMSIGDALIRVNQDGIISLFNKSAEEITGYSAAEAIGRPLEDVFHMLDYETKRPMENLIPRLLIIEKIETNSPDYREQTLITKSGKYVLVAGTITPLIRSGKEVPGYVLAFRDVSEKYQREAQSALSQKMEAIGQMAAGIAHEINTPIQYIGDNINFFQRTFTRFAEVLNLYHDCLKEHAGKTVTAEKIAEMEETYRQKKIDHYLAETPAAIQESQEGIDRVRKIVVAIREFSHTSDQDMKLADLNKAIETTITISRNEWKYVADMETDLDPNLPQVYCQIDEINQVILNMIVNASQAIQQALVDRPGEKGIIKISTRADLSKVFVSIADNGTGIPDSIMNRIFDPFFTTKDIGKGTGQGLALAHHIIVKKHKGKIRVETEPGKGSTFILELMIDNPIEAGL